MTHMVKQPWHLTSLEAMKKKRNEREKNKAQIRWKLQIEMMERSTSV